HPGLELAVGDRLAHVGDGGTRGEVPVHAAHVVARLVLAALVRLAPRARHEALVVAMQETVEATRDRQLEVAQGRLAPRQPRARGAARSRAGPARPDRGW